MACRVRTPKLTEAEFQRQVIAYAKLHGWRTAHFRPGLTRKGKWMTAVQGDGKGFPDLVLVRGKRMLFVELKAEGGRLTKEQNAWLLAVAMVPGVMACAWKPSAWPQIEAVLGG